MTLWLMLLIIGLITYAIRLSCIGLLGQREMPALLLKALRFVPITVLPAIILPQLFLRNNTLVLSVQNPRWIAAHGSNRGMAHAQRAFNDSCRHGRFVGVAIFTIALALPLYRSFLRLRSNRCILLPAAPHGRAAYFGATYQRGANENAASKNRAENKKRQSEIDRVEQA